MNPNIVELNETDYNEYLSLMNNYRKVNTNMTKSEFIKIYNEINKNSRIYVYIKNKKLVGSITLITEQKFINNSGKVGHIEDIYVSELYRNNGIGKQLIDFAKMYFKLENCYKIVLFCDKHMISYYENLNFINYSNQMRFNI